MPINSKYIEAFTESTFLHVTCKAISNVHLFRDDNNRRYFLKKYAEYSYGYLETYCYILLDNHVHWLVRTVAHESLTDFLNLIPLKEQKLHQKRYLKNEISFEEAMEFQLKDFFICYAMSYNKKYNRAGALFLNPFRRVQVEDEQHFTQIVIYQHANVVKHGILKDFESYFWSSYGALLSDKPTVLKRDEVLNWFGGRGEFIRMHREMSAYYYAHPIAIE
jgi:putative transposase